MESFCYAPGDEISAFDTPLGRIGLVMCWEQLRWKTVERMQGKTDLIIGGSCWWNFAPEDGEAFCLYESNRSLAENAPKQLAEILGVPVLHASHKAVFSGGALKDFGTVCRRRIEGFAEARDAYGEKISPEMTAPGYCLVEVNPGCVKKDGYGARRGNLAPGAAAGFGTGLLSVECAIRENIPRESETEDKGSKKETYFMIIYKNPPYALVHGEGFCMKMVLRKRFALGF